MMGDLVQFPRPAVVQIEYVATDGVNLIVYCNGALHAFRARDESCQCGDHEWTDEE